MTGRSTADTSSTGAGTDVGYVFANAAEPTSQRLAGLAAGLDPSSIRHLRERGVGPGWHCLEVGAGGGSIAVWLAEQVGPSGSVLATDIDTRFLEGLARPNLAIRRHDIATDPLPEAAFDLVHARLVLVHVPQRDTALQRMVRALKPGGWLVVEEPGAPVVQPEPELDPAEVPLKAHEVMEQVIAARGVDARYGRRIAGHLRELGLVDIGAEGSVSRVSGGSAAARVVQAGIARLREPILATGRITEQEFDDDLARLEDPALAWPSRLLWTTWGRRPAAQAG